MMRIFMIALLFMGLAQLSAEGQGRYKRAGLTDDSLFTNYYVKFRTAVAMNDSVEVSSFMLYPVRAIFNDGKTIYVRDRRDFLHMYSRLFNRHLRNLILTTDPDSLTATSTSIMLGRGQIWFQPYLDHGKLQDGIITINTMTSLYKH